MIFKKKNKKKPMSYNCSLASTKVSWKLVTFESDLIVWLGNSFGWKSSPNQTCEDFLEMEFSVTSKSLSSLNPRKRTAPQSRARIVLKYN